MGCVPAVPGYFKAMTAVCHKYGALLILDEVMCGMGRTGTLHAWEQEGIVPDIQTMGKGLGGGYQPVAAVLINRHIAEILEKGTSWVIGDTFAEDVADRWSRQFVHGHTYQGHPVACAAALEVQRIIKDDNMLSNVMGMGALLSALLIEGLKTHKNVGNGKLRRKYYPISLPSRQDRLCTADQPSS
jgi:adenosylmethionine-8-amino-7-oxononanoate aminotransferase